MKPVSDPGARLDRTAARVPPAKVNRSKGKRVARRAPAVARQEILTAAAWFLENHPFSEMTVGRLMEHTKISRSAFYVYFNDIEHLVEALVEDVMTELAVFGARLAEAEARGDQDAALTTFLNNVVNFWVRRGPMFAAVLDAAQNYPALARGVSLTMSVNGAHIDTILHHERAAGRAPADSDIETGAFLLLATQAYLKSRLGQAGETDPLTVYRTLQAMWERILYARTA